MKVMLEVDYVDVGWEEDNVLVGDGSLLLNEKILAKYYNKLAKLDESKMFVGDSIYWDEFKKCEDIVHSKKVIGKTCHCL